MKNILILLTVLMMSCSANKDLVTIKYKPAEAYPEYTLDVPKGYDLKILSVTVENEQRYTYNDSSVIYLTNFKNTPNYENIKEMGDSVFNYRFQNEAMTKEINQLLGKESVKVLPNTLELTGIDKNSLYWKDIKVGKISIGYQKVPEEKKELFDNVLKTLKVK